MQNKKRSMNTGVATISFMSQFYPFKVVFKRRFTKGTLKGLTHNDQVHHVSVVACKDWIAGVERNSARGAIDYELETTVICHSGTGMPVE